MSFTTNVLCWIRVRQIWDRRIRCGHGIMGLFESRTDPCPRKAEIYFYIKLKKKTCQKNDSLAGKPFGGHVMLTYDQSPSATSACPTVSQINCLIFRQVFWFNFIWKYSPAFLGHGSVREQNRPISLGLHVIHLSYICLTLFQYSIFLVWRNIVEKPRLIEVCLSLFVSHPRQLRILSKSQPSPQRPPP